MSRLKLVIALRALMSSSMMTTAVAQDGVLPNYAPLLPQAKARAWAVDPQKGYVVRELKPNVYLITNGAYQALFITTGSGVILFDASDYSSTWQGLDARPGSRTGSERKNFGIAFGRGDCGGLC
jgi:hypothetical protein